MGMPIRKGSLSWKILEVIEKSTDGIVRINDFTYHSYIYAAGYERPLKKTTFSKAIRRLREFGLIEQYSENNQLLIKLTNTAKTLSIMNHVQKRPWDGLWRIVIFDIPEQKRVVRNLFRRNLKKWGFRSIQKSVWVSKDPFFDALVGYVKDLRIEPYVLVFESKTVSPHFHKVYDRTINGKR